MIEGLDLGLILAAWIKKRVSERKKKKKKKRQENKAGKKGNVRKREWD